MKQGGAKVVLKAEQCRFCHSEPQRRISLRRGGRSFAGAQDDIGDDFGTALGMKPVRAGFDRLQIYDPAWLGEP